MAGDLLSGHGVRLLLRLNNIDMALPGGGRQRCGIQGRNQWNQTWVVANGHSSVRSKAQSRNDADGRIEAQICRKLPLSRPQRVFVAEEAPLINFGCTTKI